MSDWCVCGLMWVILHPSIYQRADMSISSTFLHPEFCEMFLLLYTCRIVDKHSISCFAKEVCPISKNEIWVEKFRCNSLEYFHRVCEIYKTNPNHRITKSQISHISTSELQTTTLQQHNILTKSLTRRSKCTGMEATSGLRARSPLYTVDGVDVAQETERN